MQYRVHLRLSVEADDGRYVADGLTVESHGTQDGDTPADALRKAVEKVEQTVKAKLGESK